MATAAEIKDFAHIDFPAAAQVKDCTSPCSQGAEATEAQSCQVSSAGVTSFLSHSMQRLDNLRQVLFWGDWAGPNFDLVARPILLGLDSTTLDSSFGLQKHDSN